MKTALLATAALLAGTAVSNAGGIERTSQSVSMIFEEGTYAEFSFSLASPSVSGIDPAAMETGILSPEYTGSAGGFKLDATDKIGVALIFDQPFGSAADYTAGFYTGTNADLTSSAITVVASYDVTDRIVVYAGGTYQSMSATAEIQFVAEYSIVADSDAGTGYLVGAAYQIPDIALRVALTYRSEVSTTHDTLEYGAVDGTIDIVTPQSVNLEFQSGVNQKTLVFGSVRWVDWSEFDITPANYPLGALVDYDDDRITYNLGVGRKLSDTLSAAVTVGYEENLGGDPTPLGPTDGFFSLGGGLTYTMGAATITGGVKYIWIGDSSGDAGTFENNNALGFGLKVSIAM